MAGDTDDLEVFTIERLRGVFPNRDDVVDFKSYPGSSAQLTFVVSFLPEDS